MIVTCVSETTPAPALGFFGEDFVKDFTRFFSADPLSSSVALMGTEFTPVFLFVLVAILIAISMLVLSHLLGPRRNTPVKQMPYESGMDPIGDARQRFDVRYYLVAIVFLLFDVELLYLYPWAVAQYSATVATAPPTPAAAVPLATAGVPPVFRNLVFLEIILFIVILAAAFAYAWRKGVFEWR
jgi:NADH-quinone oxidoreductase subunit A